MALKKRICPQKQNQNLKLYIHIFPSTEFDRECFKIDKEKNILHVRHPTEPHNSLGPNKTATFWNFKTEKIFYNCCQSDIYSTIRNDVFESISLGVDHVLMSYGQNNSGKTFLLTGLYNQFDLRGLLPRFASDLFHQKELMKANCLFYVFINVVDIYSNSIIDLLSKPTKICKQPKEVKSVKLKSISHCFELLFKTESKRKACYSTSYKSHFASYIVTFTIRSNSLASQNDNEKISRISFIDLAGVETVQRNQFTSFKDGQSQGDANLTKTLLEIFALRSQKFKCTNKRANNCSVSQNIHKLTQYLGNSFALTSVKAFFCHVRPNHEDLMITLSLLKFGMIFKCIPIEKTELSMEYYSGRNNERAEVGVNLLQKRILTEKLEENNYPIEISQGRIEFVKRSVELFIKGELTELDLISMFIDFNLVLALLKSYIKENPITLNAEIQTDLQRERYSYLNNSFMATHNTPSLNTSISSKQNNEVLPKHVSFSKSKEINEKKSMKGKKNPGTKNEGEGNVHLLSEGVQVNLIEPKIHMPSVDTREHHWAVFLIAKPEVQSIIDKMISTVKEREQTLQESKLKYEKTEDNLIKTQLKMNVLRCSQEIRNTGKNNECHLEDKERDLLQETIFLEKELEINRKLMVNHQIDWLDCLYTMNDTTQKIEREFKQFCSKNNFVVLESEVLIEAGTKQSIITEKEVSTNKDNEVLQNMYNDFQSRYLTENGR